MIDTNERSSSPDVFAECDSLRAQLSEAVSRIATLEQEKRFLQQNAMNAEERAVELMALVGQGQAPAQFQSSHKGKLSLTEECIEERQTATR